MLTLTKRNLLLYLKNKNLIIFSFLSVFIILGLYIFLLGEKLEVANADYNGSNLIVASWLLAGIIGIIPISTAMGSLANIIIDRQRGTYYDLAVAPIRKSDIVGGYVISTFLTSFVFSIITYALAQVYLISLGNAFPSMEDILRITMIISINTLAATAVVFMIATFFKRTETFSVFNSILGSVIGFVSGILVPIGSLAGLFQIIVKMFPFSHSVLLIRNNMMRYSMSIAFEEAPVQVLDNFKQSMGLVYEIGDNFIDVRWSFIYLFIVFISTLFISIRRMSNLNIEDTNW